jgi:hypothetical protein
LVRPFGGGEERLWNDQAESFGVQIEMQIHLNI